MFDVRLVQHAFYFLLLIIVLGGCGGGSSSGGESEDMSGPLSCSISELESSLDRALSGVATDVDFSFIVERVNDGRQYQYHRGASTLQTSYESASTSKWVAAAVILRLVQNGNLSLSDRPQDHIATWSVPMDDPLYNMTLAQLLSFTSGLENEPFCLNLPSFDFESCVVNNIVAENVGNTVNAGERFYYASTHLQVAGLMAVRALNVSTWQDVFEAFKSEVGLFSTANFDLPSMTNPRLAGGMHWVGDEYLAFIRALQNGSILDPPVLSEMLRDQTELIELENAPISALNEEWHYGLGLWHECENERYNCVAGDRVSSPGAYGAYPFWGRAQGYFGLVARQGRIGTSTNGIELERAVRATVEVWVACD